MELTVEQAWKELNKIGIYTMEQFEEEDAKLEPINISCMASPVKGITDKMDKKPDKNRRKK
jgi:hypothetical protein